MRTVKSAKVRRLPGGEWGVTLAFRDGGPNEALAFEPGAIGGLISGVKGPIDQRARSDEKRKTFENNMLYAMLAERTGMTLTGLKQVVMSRMDDQRDIDREEHGPQGKAA